jgi:hypothetical protein
MNPPRFVVLAVVGMVAAAPRAYADDEGLRKDTWRAAATAAGGLALSLVFASLGTAECRICAAGRIDMAVRDGLRWSNTAPALHASGALAYGALPLLAAADAARSTPNLAATGRDLLVVAEAASLSSLATEIGKDAFARRRPGLPTTGRTSSDGNKSLWSGHTSFAFAIAVAQATQDTLRGDPAAPWAWVIGLTLASAAGYFRIAGDVHWFTDVLAGAAVGSAFGVGVPLLEKRLVGVTISPAPGGIVVRF